MLGLGTAELIIVLLALACAVGLYSGMWLLGRYHAPERKPQLAALLGGILGPMGWIYVTFKGALIASAVVAAVAGIAVELGAPKGDVRFLIMALSALGGWYLCKYRNSLLARDEPQDLQEEDQ